MFRTAPMARWRGRPWITKVLDFHLGTRSGRTAMVVAIALVACWMVSVLFGGAGHVPPHLFYIPTILAASWYGRLGTLMVTLVAGLLAGPLLPLDTATGEAQRLSDWTVRLGFFVASGEFARLMFRRFERALTNLRSSELIVRSLMGGSGMDGKTKREALGQRARVRALMETPAAIQPVFQPIVDLTTGETVGMEALSRFHFPTERSPIEWFTDAWEVGLGIELELRAAEAALAYLRVLPADAYLAINLSPATVLSPQLQELLPTLPLERLVIEMTEHAPVSDYDALLRPLRYIRARGGRIAVDDAGAGFASFRHIIKLSPDIIKLDIALTRNIDTSESARHLADFLISYGARIGAVIIAEGVETQGELETLRGLGARCGQGYHIGRPAPLRQLALLPV